MKCSKISYSFAQVEKRWYGTSHSAAALLLYSKCGAHYSILISKNKLEVESSTIKQILLKYMLPLSYPLM